MYWSAHVGTQEKRLPHIPLISPNNISDDPIAAAIGNKVFPVRSTLFIYILFIILAIKTGKLTCFLHSQKKSYKNN